MRISVILSTYNQPEWLEKSLIGYGCQSYSDFEIVIADDGSSDSTREVIDRMSASLNQPIKHVWHEDDGFRKCRILNLAILESSGDYLIFSDGDCIPQKDFVLTHRNKAEAGHFLSGGYLKLPMALSKAITSEDIETGETGRFADPKWLLANGMPPNKGMLKLITNRSIKRLLNSITTTKATWNGHNASGWKTDMLTIDGFDERMGYGGQDREFGERLINLGIRPKQIRFSTVCLHLDHKRSYIDKAKWRANYEIRKKTRKNRLIRTEYGISKILDTKFIKL